mgnify:CR=1 FL=1
MAKNPFKKKSLMDTLTNVGIGGAANVAIDYIWDVAGLDATLTFESISADTLKNGIKILGGALAGGMISNKYGRAAADGVATVGVSNLIASLIDTTTSTSTSTSTSADGSAGLPHGTIGRVPRYGRRAARARVAGLNDFME